MLEKSYHIKQTRRRTVSALQHVEWASSRVPRPELCFASHNAFVIG